MRCAGHWWPAWDPVQQHGCHLGAECAGGRGPWPWRGRPGRKRPPAVALVGGDWWIGALPAASAVLASHTTAPRPPSPEPLEANHSHTMAAGTVALVPLAGHGIWPWHGSSAGVQGGAYGAAERAWQRPAQKGAARASLRPSALRLCCSAVRRMYRTHSTPRVPVMMHMTSRTTC